MRSIYKICLLICFLIAPVVTVNAGNNEVNQQDKRVVKGVVVDESGEAVIGATVTVVGQKTGGTVTDVDGRFSITVPAGKKLRISYIGYVAQTVSDLSDPRVVLKEDGAFLDDVVVVGYGSLKQKNVTGAVEVITPDELKDLAVSNLSEALIGISPSLHIDMPSTGRPGENATITIRQAKDAVALVPTGKDAGGMAIGGNSNPAPLYVIDDFVYQDSEKGEDEFNNLDVDEVESITILKDAAAAVYGAYGAYGVILVKTKRGRQGQPKISYQTQLSYTDAIKHAEMLNGYQYGTIYNAARAANVLQSGSKDDKLLNYFQADELEAMKSMNYNLLDKYWKSALTQRHSVNVNGGTEKVTYFAGLSYYTQDGNLGKLDYERYNYRAGLTANISKYVKATVSISGDTSTRDSHEGNSEEDYKYLLKNPAYVPDNINGYPIYNSGMETNPANTNYYNYKSLQESRNNRERSDNSMSIQATLEHDFGWIKPLKGLRARLTYSRNISNQKDNRIRMENTVYRVKNRGGSGRHLYITDPTMIIDNDPDVDYDETTLEGFRYTDFENLEQRVLNSGQSSFISREMSRSDSYQINFMLMYGRKFGKHDVSGTFSIERGESWMENVWAEGTHPLSFTDGQSNSLSDDAVKDVAWNRSEGGSLAYIGRLNYAYSDKYLFEFLVRAQASTKFSPENYWGAFPSVSAGWVMSEENWFNKEKTKIDFLKFRASFGVMGRDNVDPWRWLQLYNYNSYGGSIFGTNPAIETSRSFQLPEKSGTNPNLRWDKNYKTNFGIDLRMFDNRLSVTFDAYYDMGREMFAFPGASNLPGTVGIYAAPENYSEMDMFGFEAIVGWRQRINKDMYVSARLGFGYDDNRVRKYYWVSDEQRTWTDYVKGGRTDRGLWGLSCLGMFRSYQEIEEYFTKYKITNYLGLTQDQVHPGMLIYEDIRGAKDENGNYTAPDGVINSNDDAVMISKRANNPYTSNLNLNFVYKSLSINATFQGEWGAYTLMPGALRGESFSDMETTNVSAMWKDMFIYEDVYDAAGQVIARANRNGRWPNFGFNKGNINSVASTFWRISATKILLRNITLAYTLPKKWAHSIGLSNVRVNATCQNALSLYNSIPGGYWDSTGFSGNYGSYPVVRKITVGVNVTF